MNITEAINIVKNSGYKVTGKREQMLEIFSASNKYITAKELLEEMQEDYPGLSFDTIYRNLSLFNKLGILESTELAGEKHFRYTCSVHDHHHQDRKSTRLNSSHVKISYAVFCLKKKKPKN